MTKALQARSAVLSPKRVALVGRAAEPVRAIEAYLHDAGASSTRLTSVKLEQLLVLDVHAAVVLVQDFDLSAVLPTLKEVNARRPELALLLLGRHRERFELWHAFEGSRLPPLLLRESVSAAVIYDALRIACDASAIEDLDERSAPSGALDAVVGSVSDVARALTVDEPLRDRAFDRFLPLRLRAASGQFWTPLDVVKRAVTWFEELAVGSVVDIGSGAGKFCIAGALMSPCSFIGIEQRFRLATVARNLARVFGVEERVSFIDGRFGEVTTPAADCYYLYNPFEENLFPECEALDDEVELSADRFRRDVRCFRALVASMPIGTYLLTYNGVGGRMPDCLDEIRVDRELPAVLRLLQKVRTAHG